MHWWKKFLSNFFTSDKKIDEPTEIRLENHPKNEQHEMKTRMIYQYPKGEFRFPLIKDQPAPAKPSKDRKKQSPDRYQEENEYQEENRREEKRAKHHRQGNRSKTASNISRKIEPKNHQPFEPTHIPSPIYGFNRPIKRKELPKIPEVELTDLKPELKIETNEQTLEKQGGIGDNISEENLQKDVFSNDPIIQSEEVPNEMDLDSGAQEEEDEEINVVEISNWAESIEEAESYADPDKAEPAQIHTDLSQQEEALDEVFPDEPAVTEPSLAIEEDFFCETEEINGNNEIPNEIEKESLQSMVEENNGEFETETPEEPAMAEDEPMKTDESSLEVEAASVYTALDEKVTAAVDPEYDILNNEEEEPVDSTKSEASESADEILSEKQEAETEKLNKPRSNLPFNVLMLSQDKMRWKRQRERESRDSGNVVDAMMKTTEAETAAASEPTTVHYEFPGIRLLKPPVFKEENTEWLNEQTALLDETMENFNVRARVVKASQGPSVTRFEVQPDKGVKVNKITNLSNDIKLSMAARDIRMEAPIPGTRSIGIELPNKDSRPVQISEIIGKDVFLRAESPLTAALGLDISGEPIVTDLRKMPHGLIAGATGSGKSVCINSILVSLLYKARPDELKLMLIDPKMVELAPYNHIPHLVSPVITDVKAATAALKWAVDEMERRYELFVHAGVRDIGRFNELAKTKGQKSEHLPYIVIVIDELADLMMVAPSEVEESICRIAQKARACGIHLLIATQRPSVDVITGLIKANVPTRIAFAVSSQVDSRTVIDVSGAEKLLGRGDMLFLNNGSVKPVRLQGTFVSDEEIDGVIDHVRNQGKPNYLFQQDELLKKAEIQENEDELFMDACEFVVKQGNASTSLLQRQFRIGYNRAARLMEMMEEQGVISGAKGSKPRDVLIKEAELDVLKDSLVH